MGKTIDLTNFFGGEEKYKIIGKFLSEKLKHSIYYKSVFIKPITRSQWCFITKSVQLR